MFAFGIFLAPVTGHWHILMAYKVNENPLPDEFFPLRLVGSDLEKKEMVGMIAEIHVGVEPLADVPAAASTESAAATVSEADATLTVFGSVNQQLLLNEAALREMEVLTINAEHPKNGKQDFEGVSLNTLLDLAGVKDSATTLVFIAADGYTSEVSIEEVRACTECLVGFTNTLEKFKMVMPNLPSSAWAKDVIKIEVK